VVSIPHSEQVVRVSVRIRAFPLARLALHCLQRLGSFELLIVEEELLTRRKDEVSAAVNTLEDSIREFHGRLPNRGAFRSGYDFSEHAVPVPVFVCPNNGPGPHLTRRH